MDTLFVMASESCKNTKFEGYCSQEKYKLNYIMYLISYTFTKNRNYELRNIKKKLTHTYQRKDESYFSKKMNTMTYKHYKEDAEQEKIITIE